MRLWIQYLLGLERYSQYWCWSGNLVLFLISLVRMRTSQNYLTGGFPLREDFLKRVKEGVIEHENRLIAEFMETQWEFTVPTFSDGAIPHVFKSQGCSSVHPEQVVCSRGFWRYLPHCHRTFSPGSWLARYGTAGSRPRLLPRADFV